MNEPSSPNLYYVHDPMCSWCWGYQPTLVRVEAWLKNKPIQYRKLLGGLAPDSSSPMPQEMRERIEHYWHKIHRLLGTSFNHDFWKVCTPKRSTYPACRATLIARQFDREDDMILAIQKAYYLEALNPSEPEVLCALARKIGLPAAEFATALSHEETQRQLQGEIEFTRSIGGNTFPSWIIVENGQFKSLEFDYKDESSLQNQILLALHE